MNDLDVAYRNPAVALILKAASAAPRLDELPQELREGPAFHFCESDGAIATPRRERFEPGQTARKRADELRPGDLIRHAPDDRHGCKVEQVTIDGGRVHVSGSGPPFWYERCNARVTVFTVPPQTLTWTELVLTDRGRRVLARVELTKAAGSDVKLRDPPVDWDDFRNGPGGELLTVNVCDRDFGVSGKVLSQDTDAKRTRRRHPKGRGYVYPYSVVARLANRKSFD